MKRYRMTYSMKAIFAGALTGFGLNFLLNLLSLAIGLSVFVEKSGDQLNFSFTGFIAFFISAIISMFATGWISGRLTYPSYRIKPWGILYGFLAWTLCFILTVILITNMLHFTYFHSSFTSKELIAIRITNNMPMIAETKSANADLNKKVISVDAQVTFVLFLLGALSSGIGGYLGYQPREKKIS